MAKDEKKIFKSVDVISKELDAVDNFVLRHWKKYVYIAIGVVVIFAAAIIIIRHFENKTASSSRQLANAVTLEQLQNAVQSNPKNVLTPYCQMQIVPMLVESNDMDGARKICEGVIFLAQNPYLISRAKVDLGYIAEVKGNNEEALKLFAQIAADISAPEQFKAESLYNSGRIYLAMGKKDQAIDSLKKCAAIPDNSCAGWQEFARNLMNRVN